MTEPVEPNLGVLLFIAYRQMESAALAALRDHGHRLSLNEARVFQRIDAAGSRMSELAEAAQMSKQTATSIVDRLESAGYVERRPDPADARARLVTISDAGHELIALTVPVIARIEADWERHLGPAKTDQLRRILADLREVADPFLDNDGDRSH